ncbi:Hypothetical protein HVR_LOCUS1013 [uncultured virus]|nr:Hypothetical protein HVR_LOCUS1013 [uncultured virus]
MTDQTSEPLTDNQLTEPSVDSSTQGTGNNNPIDNVPIDEILTPERISCIGKIASSLFSCVSKKVSGEEQEETPNEEKPNKDEESPNEDKKKPNDDKKKKDKKKDKKKK